MIGPTHEWPRVTRERMPASQPASQPRFKQKKLWQFLEGRQRGSWQRSAGPGKTGLRRMAKGSPVQEVSKKDVKWDKVGSCEWCLALLSFYGTSSTFLLYSIHSFPWASGPQAFLWLWSFLLVRLAYKLTLHRVHGKTKFCLQAKEERSKLYPAKGLPTPGPIHTHQRQLSQESLRARLVPMLRVW